MMITEETRFVFNGINGETGEYLYPPMIPEQILDVACSPENETDIQEIENNIQDKGKKHFRPMEGVDAKNLAETGWGVIFARDDSKAKDIKKKLTSLLDHRRQQAKQNYKEHEYCKNELKDEFLRRHNVGNTNVVDPSKIPYYLLIVADPETIPYSFQYQLDVAYAVGRLYFEELEDYERYAHNVVKVETDKILRPRRAVFFGVHNERDEPTEKSAKQLISPLSRWMEEDKEIKGWEVQTFLKNEAHKEQLKKLLGGSQTPGFLFTASHGVGFHKGHPQQLSHQGALLCHDWPGLKTPPTKDKNFYFSADDVGDDAQLHGLITFHFACHSVGTPDIDSFATPSNRKKIADKPFVARLPQRLLSQGALAVVGHVDRVLKFSFSENYGIKQLEAFQDSLRRLMNGHPVGSAVESFNEHYSGLACDLLEKIQDPLADQSDSSEQWLSFKNARSYAIIGDPAVRLAVKEALKFEQLVGETTHQSATHPTLELSTHEETTLTLMIASTESTVVDIGNLRQAEGQLIQALEEFVNVVQQAPTYHIKELQLTVEVVKNKLYEAAKTLESIKLKQAQFQLTEALEQFISTFSATSTEQAEHLQLKVKAAKQLLESLKELS